MPVSDTYQNIALDQITVGGADDPPATRYWGLRHNGAEVSAVGSAYARVAMTSATFGEPATYPDATNARANADRLDFATPTADWAYVNELCLYDGASDPDPALVFTVQGNSGEALFISNGAPLSFLDGEIILYIFDGN